MAKQHQKNQGRNRNRHRNRHQQTNARKNQHNSKPVPQGLVTSTIEKLSHDGRGIARIEGKTTFVDGALPGELVELRYVQCHGRYDEAVVVQVLEPSPERIPALCKHATVCGGCSLQHLGREAQVSFKQSVLLEQLTHFGELTPQAISAPIVGESQGYRRKARLSVKHNVDNACVIGFREKSRSRVVPITQCTVLAGDLGNRIPELQELISGLKNGQVISHIDVIEGDTSTALVFRHPKPLGGDDLRSILAYCQQHQFHLYLQPGGADSIYQAWPENGDERLSYVLQNDDAANDVIEVRFHPSDFIQVNTLNNRKLVSQAIELLDLNAEDRVLDLFCGIGNFTLPIAKLAGSVVGVEGNDLMVIRGKENASYNKLSNVEFYGADLTKIMDNTPWAQQGFTKILIDPPRAGALEVVKNLARFSPEKIVYVSCNPATLARDAGEFSQQGYQLISVGVVDMFPHTTHVESIALFEPSR